MCRMVIAFIFLGCVSSLSANDSEKYIRQYYKLAISEMERTGIPASIKLAQALLESGAGKSTLAREANNHFGIKCNGGWTGKTHYREDDDYKDGKLIKSCFRKYEDAGESFIAHSDFLTKQPRYSDLFLLSAGDFHGWAYGLKKAGYATDKRYPVKLVDLIDKYNLSQYDNGQVVAQVTEPSDDIFLNEDTGAEEVVVVDSKSKRNSRTSRKTSSRKKSSSRKSSKRTRNTKDQIAHVVTEGQTIKEIASYYELDATILRLRNRIPKDAEPLAGEEIYLRKKINIFRRPKFTRGNQDVASVDGDFIF